MESVKIRKSNGQKIPTQSLGHIVKAIGLKTSSQTVHINSTTDNYCELEIIEQLIITNNINKTKVEN